MKKLMILIFVLIQFRIPVYAAQYTAPLVPESGRAIMPDTSSFSEGIWTLVQKAVSYINPDYREALQSAVSILAAMMIVAVLQAFHQQSQSISELVGICVLSTMLLWNTKSMIHLGAETVEEISMYGKLLLPVLTTALAAQGGVSTSAALYAGTVMFNTILGTFLTQILIPFIYMFLALAIGTAAAEASILKNMRDTIKTFSAWCLKIMLTVFTTYMSIQN